MRKLIFSIAVLLSAASFVDAASPQIKQQQIHQDAQYQIAAVEYNYLNTNGDNVKKAVLKIDMFTGKTWILRDDTYKTTDGRIIVNRGWEELEININEKYPIK